MQHDYFWHPLIILFWIVAAVAVIGLIVRRSHKHHCHHEHNAVELLRERYAKGEISTAEFEERKKALEVH